MALLTWSPIVILILAALLIWLLNTRLRTIVLGQIAIAALLLAVAINTAAPLLGAPVDLSFTWSMLNGQPLTASLRISDLATIFVPMLLLGGAVAAGGIAWTFGRATRTFGLVFAGLLVLIAGGLITAYGAASVVLLLGLGVVWIGGTIMQQSATAHTDQTTLSGLPLLMLATILLGSAQTPPMTNGPAVPLLWFAACAVLISSALRWGTTNTTPLLVRAPVALGLPLLGGYLLTQYAIANAQTWSGQTTLVLLIGGVAGLALGAINALTAERLSDLWSWQLIAQLAFIAICFGTGRPEAGPIATGLLIHTLVVNVVIALALGQLERATRTDILASLPPLPTPLRRAGLAYGLAAVSSVGIPPLLGYGLRRVVLILAGINNAWLPAVLLALSTVLALSYVPALVAFFRRPAFRSPIASVDQRGGGWPLLLIGGVLLGGLIPDVIWQYVLGDPGVTEPQLPPFRVLASTLLSAFVAIALFGLINRTLRRAEPAPIFTGGEPLDEEPGWALPFASLRHALRPLVIPMNGFSPQTRAWIDEQRDRLARPLLAIERRYYLALVVVSLISVLLLAAQ